MSDFAIRGIEVHQIGVFENLKLKFPENGTIPEAEIHIFTGENGSGKSTLLQLLAGVFSPEIFQNKLLLKFRNLEKSSFGFEINNTLSGPHYRNENGQIKSNVGLNIVHRDYVRNLTGDYRHTEFDFALFAYSGYRRVDSLQLLGIKEIEVHPMADSLNFDKSINPNSILQWIANMKNSEYRAIAKNLKDSSTNGNGVLKELEKVIKEMIGQKVEFEIEENPFRVVVLVDGLSMDFDSLPDGLKSIISWIADLLMRMQRIRWKDNIPVFERRFILFLDEIEVHLHPAWQRKVLPIIQKLFKNAQIFISTHSPFVVGSVDGAWIYRLKFDGKKTTVAPPTRSEDGESFVSILKEIFDVKEQFGQAVEKKLDAFYLMKNKTLSKKEISDLAKIESMAKNLMGQSDELDLIVEMEMRQIHRQFSQPASI